MIYLRPPLNLILKMDQLLMLPWKSLWNRVIAIIYTYMYTHIIHWVWDFTQRFMVHHISSCCTAVLCIRIFLRNFELPYLCKWSVALNFNITSKLLLRPMFQISVMVIGTKSLLSRNGVRINRIRISIMFNIQLTNLC